MTLLAARLVPGDFFTEHHAAIFERLLAMHAAGRAIDRVTLAAELRAHGDYDRVGGMPKLLQLEEEGSTLTYVPEYARLILEAALNRALLRISAATITTAFDNRPPAEGLRRLRDELADLERRVGATTQPLPAYSWSEVISQAPEKLVFLWPGWVLERRVMLVAGAGDSMKSFLCTFLAAMVGAGRPALDDDGAPCRQGAALIVSAENGLEEDRRRFHLLRRGYDLPDDLPVTLLDAGSLSLRDPATWASFITLVQVQRPRLIVIDSGIAVADLENENDNASVAAFMKNCIVPLARIHGATVLLIVHSPKPPKEKGLVLTDEHVARGASAWRNSADGMLYLKRDRSLGEHAVVLRPAKARGGYRHPPIWFHIKNTELDTTETPPIATAVKLEYGGTFTEETGQASAAAAALGKALEAGIQVLKQTPGSRIQVLVDALVGLKISEATARRAIAVLRGHKEWPAGPYVGKKQSVVDEAPGPRKMVFLTFNPSMDAALAVSASEDDDVPF
jgi:hypothetical protein